MPACPGPRFLPWPQVPVRGPRVGSLSPLPVVHAASLPSCSPSRPAGRPSPSVLRCLSPSSCAAADPTSLSPRKESRQKGTAARLPLCVCPHALLLGCREPPLCPEEAPAPEQILSPPANPPEPPIPSLLCCFIPLVPQGWSPSRVLRPAAGSPVIKTALCGCPSLLCCPTPPPAALQPSAWKQVPLPAVTYSFPSSPELRQASCQPPSSTSVATVRAIGGSCLASSRGSSWSSLYVTIPVTFDAQHHPLLPDTLSSLGSLDTPVPRFSSPSGCSSSGSFAGSSCP